MKEFKKNTKFLKDFGSARVFSVDSGVVCRFGIHKSFIDSSELLSYRKKLINNNETQSNGVRSLDKAHKKKPRRNKKPIGGCMSSPTVVYEN